MKKTITTLLIATVLLTSCNNGGSSASANRPKTPEELKAELKQQEQLNPTQYLTVQSGMQPNQVQTREAGLFHNAEFSTDGYNITGTIKNSATVAKYKDVILTVQFMSKTETVIEEKDYPLYDFFQPNSTTPFTLKVYPPASMEKYGVGVKGATGVN